MVYPTCAKSAKCMRLLCTERHPGKESPRWVGVFCFFLFFRDSKRTTAASLSLGPKGGVHDSILHPPGGGFPRLGGQRRQGVLEAPSTLSQVNQNESAVAKTKLFPRLQVLPPSPNKKTDRCRGRKPRTVFFARLLSSFSLLQEARGADFLAPASGGSCGLGFGRSRGAAP